MAEKIKLFALRNMGRPCILCGNPCNAVGVFFPNNKVAKSLGMKPGTHVLYPTCSECIADRKEELVKKVDEYISMVQIAAFSRPRNRTDPSLN